MRKGLVVLTACLVALAAAACSAADQTQVPNSPAPAVTALFVGDSYTEGVGLAAPRTERWSALVSAQYGWSEVHAACSGSGYTRQGLLCGTTYVERLPSLGAIDADVVVIWGGVNDAGATPDDAAAAARDTIAAYAKAFPDAELVVISAVYFASPEPPALAAINVALPVAVTQTSGTWIDIGPLFAEDPSLLGTDGLHPNAAGHRAISDAVIAALDEGD